MDRYDVIVIGGGIYGSLGAVLAAGAGRSVLLLELEDRLLEGVSAINQATGPLQVRDAQADPRSDSSG